MLLLTLFFLSNFLCAQIVSNPLDEPDQTWHTPFPNMEAGLVGYDPVFADPVGFRKDPGKYLMM